MNKFFFACVFMVSLCCSSLADDRPSVLCSLYRTPIGSLTLFMRFAFSPPDVDVIAHIEWPANWNYTASFIGAGHGRFNYAYGSPPEGSASLLFTPIRVTGDDGSVQTVLAIWDNRPPAELIDGPKVLGGAKLKLSSANGELKQQETIVGKAVSFQGNPSPISLSISYLLPDGSLRTEPITSGANGEFVFALPYGDVQKTQYVITATQTINGIVRQGYSSQSFDWVPIPIHMTPASRPRIKTHTVAVGVRG
ncbi:hypothetical protein BH11ARM1_BH11ARM1_16220 [soil metagenome]